jgi:hypothetical protein
MDKISKTAFIHSFVCLALLFLLCSAKAEEMVMDLNIKDNTISANLIEAPFKDIIEKIEKEKGIWFKGSDSITDEKLSVQFQDLSLQEALGRILSVLNYSLIFDKDSKLVGVFIVGKLDNIRSNSNSRKVTRKRTRSSRSSRRDYKSPRRDR